MVQGAGWVQEVQCRVQDGRVEGGEWAGVQGAGCRVKCVLTPEKDAGCCRGRGQVGDRAKRAQLEEGEEVDKRVMLHLHLEEAFAERDHVLRADLVGDVGLG